MSEATMNRLGAALVPVMFMGLSLAAGQEQRLSDVAGDMKLQPPSQTNLLVDLGSSDQDLTGPVALLELTEEFDESIRSASAVLEEARAYEPFFDQDWRDRMIESLIDLGLAAYSVDVARPPTAYAEAYGLVVDGVVGCERAEAIIRTAIDQDLPIFGTAIASLADAGRTVSDGLGRMRRIRSVEVAESAPSVADPIETTLGIESLCSSRAAGDNQRYDECVVAQQAALRSLGARFGSTALHVDQPTFNAIRNSCRREWPVDMVGRDRCEQRRIAEAQ
jgi:hypothetical protein